MTKHTNKKGKRSTSKTKKAKQDDVEVILEQALEAINNVQLEEAAELYERALRIRSADTNIMDALADVYMQLGNNDKAMTLLQQSIAAAPQENGIKWLYLAQLICGNDALSAYQMGLQILENQLQQVFVIDLRS
jgi:tetratricopeptide (TPR) repeat protein